MKLFLLVNVIVFSLFSSFNPSFAEGKPSSEMKLNKIENVPQPLQQYLMSSSSKEQYVQNVLQLIRQHGTGGEYLEQKNIEELRAKNHAQQIARQVSRTLQMDINADGKVTKKEVEGASKRRMLSESQIRRQVEELLKMDKNNDDVIDYEEMRSVQYNSNHLNRNVEPLSGLLLLDPNKDGRLSAAELETVAEEAFILIDADKNQLLSDEEKTVVREQMHSSRIHGRQVGFQSTCTFGAIKFPEEMKVFGAGAYGGRKLGMQIDQSGHEARQIDVVVTENKTPVALVLGAYEPTIWNISYLRDTEIAAVVIGGYYKQMVSGLPKDVPVISGDHESKGGCGYFYLSSDELNKLNPLSRHLFGKPAALFYPANNGTAVVGPKEYNKSRIVSKKLNYDSFVDKNAPLAGKAGLDVAVKKGVIRRATREDTEAVVKKLQETQKKQGQLDAPPVAGDDGTVSTPKPRLLMHNAYVVLKPFTYPAGLYGGNSATFIISEGVPLPSGNPGHSAVYDMNKGVCIGAICRTQ